MLGSDLGRKCPFSGRFSRQHFWIFGRFSGIRVIHRARKQANFRASGIGAPIGIHTGPPTSVFEKKTKKKRGSRRSRQMILRQLHACADRRAASVGLLTGVRALHDGEQGGPHLTTQPPHHVDIGRSRPGQYPRKTICFSLYTSDQQGLIQCSASDLRTPGLGLFDLLASVITVRR
jgi:hypothetical protein